jgi:hypothetical protein
VEVPSYNLHIMLVVLIYVIGLTAVVGIARALSARSTRLAGHASVILGVMFPVALYGEIDHVTLLNQARAKVVANIKKLPKYTCLQAVSRSTFEPIPAVRVGGCGQVEDSRAANIQPRMFLAGTDRFKLDVTVSEGAEIFSWPGDQHFQSEDVEKIVGTGMTGTGDFGPFLMSIFGEGASECDYLGLQRDKGRALAVYRYQVPMSASHYQIKVGPQPRDMVTLVYEGKFWIDLQNAELNRMTIEVPNPPLESQTCRIETAIDYRRARIGGSDFLLPELTVLNLWDMAAKRFENRILYASCREFNSESVFRTDPEPLAGPASEVPKTAVAIPAGRTIKIALRSTIASESSFAGDAIEGQLLNAIGSVVPKGAIVHGRIVRFKHQYQPSNYFAIGLIFHSVEVNGSDIPLALVAVSRSRRERSLSTSTEKRQGIGVLIFRVDRLVLDQQFVSEWKTTARKDFE